MYTGLPTFASPNSRHFFHVLDTHLLIARLTILENLDISRVYRKRKDNNLNTDLI